MAALMKRSVCLAAVAGCLSVFAAAALAQDAKGDKPAPQSTLPGGASSLNETFEDWTVSCGSAEGRTQCILLQSQTQQQSGQRVLEIRLSPVMQKNGYEGSLMLPFGLELSRGVTAQLDDGKAGKPFAFKTCFANGCLVPLDLDKPIVDAMRKGTSLKLAAVSAQNQNIPFAVSLKGFAGALDRATALTKGG